MHSGPLRGLQIAAPSHGPASSSHGLCFSLAAAKTRMETVPQLWRMEARPTSIPVGMPRGFADSTLHRTSICGGGRSGWGIHAGTPAEGETMHPRPDVRQSIKQL